MSNYKISENSNSARRKNPWIRRGIIFFSSLLLILIILLTVQFFINRYNNTHITIKTIKNAWNEYDYTKVYELSKIYLQNNPYNNTALTYYSYACFFLAQAQTDTQASQSYLDDSINNMRIALYNASKSLIPQLYYMLGCAYFYKNTITTHYYADLAVKYLKMAKDAGYVADDISEYLGLSYASLGMTKESISAFTEALLVRESDYLLLCIAEQYYTQKEYGAAKQYLYRVEKNSSNDELVVKSKNLLGQIYIEQDDLDSAQKEFDEILKMNPNSADAHYGLGLIHEKKGTLVAARSEWLKALKLQLNHSGALQKLQEN
ncbi:MAG: tetratricopeptide repeat protein [Spirochaetia bacterium]|nr:tetratricopeptide repeat protein [Spirochaetia bacterium]